MTWGNPSKNGIKGRCWGILVVAVVAGFAGFGGQRSLKWNLCTIFPARFMNTVYPFFFHHFFSPVSYSLSLLLGKLRKKKVYSNMISLFFPGKKDSNKWCDKNKTANVVKGIILVGGVKSFFYQYIWALFSGATHSGKKFETYILFLFRFLSISLLTHHTWDGVSTLFASSTMSSKDLESLHSLKTSINSCNESLLPPRSSLLAVWGFLIWA